MQRVASHVAKMKPSQLDDDGSLKLKRRQEVSICDVAVE